MLTVSDLMLSPLFNTAKIAAGKSGLSNLVLGTGFLDWENADQIYKHFNAGEFVVTTLANVKDDRKKAEKYLKTLILNNVAAIFIKNIYYNDISKELKDFADEKHVPIFFFDKVYIDDIIHETKKQLEMDIESANYEHMLDKIFNGADMTFNELNDLVDRINPYFYRRAFLAMYISDDERMCSENVISLYRYMHSNRDLLEGIKDEDIHIVYSRLIYKRGILLIISFDTADENRMVKYKESLLERFYADKKFSGMRIGVGMSDSREGFSFAVRSAVFANVSCILNECKTLTFDINSSDYPVFSVVNIPEIRDYCSKMEKLLAKPDAKHIPLLETALTFVKCGGNTEKTAESLCQHKNTVRYRLERIANIFGADNNIELYGRLYFFTRIHLSTPYLKIFFNN